VSIKVVIADDQELVRTGFRKILESEPDIEVVAEAGDGAEAVEQALLRRPDVLLLDIRMPRVDGLEAARRLAGKVRVLILTTFDPNEYVYEALRAGASGFLLKDAPADELVRAIRVVAAGEALLSPSITRRLIEEFARRPPPSERPAGLAHLTTREFEILKLVAGGLSNAEIASELYLGETTVKTHIGRILQKLDLRDRVQAVVLAYESGLVTPGGHSANVLQPGNARTIE
jgi:DNA-binding NarL/FixJ family response regulator